MQRVQIAISDAAYGAALRQMLLISVAGEVVCVDSPDPSDRGVLVVDPEHLERLPSPIHQPERVVLLTQDRPSRLSGTLERAWQAGVHSVISTKDPVSMVVLAVLAAHLRLSKCPPQEHNKKI